VPGYKLEPGADGPEELRDNLQSAKVVLGVLTNNSLDSSFVLLELGAAWGLRTRIVPLVAGVRFGAIPSPIGPDTHAVDVSDASGMASVIESIARRCDMPQRCDAAQLHDAIARFAVRVAALAGPKESPETPAAAGGLTAGELADDIGFLEGYLDHIVKIDEAHSEIRKVRPSIAFVVSGNRPPPGPSPALQEAKRRRDELGDYLERHRLRAYALVQRATGERPTWNGPELREGLVARAKADVGAALGWFQELAKRAR
jgi:hypothetical protein